MIDEQANQYGPDGNSTDFHRCAKGWRLYHEANALMSVSYQHYVIAWNEYRQHVRACHQCLAVKGRFAE
jgi:hypothetical protein